MKKIIMLLLVLSAAAITARAQENKTVPQKRSLLAISAGPVFAVGDFSAKNLSSNSGAGLAKTGYNFNLQYRYRIRESFGLGFSASYNKHNLDMTNYPTVSADHWQYYTFMIGPYLSARISDKARFDIKSFVGVGHVNDPVFSAGGITVDEQWSTAVALQIGGNLRYYFSGDWCLLVSIDYNHMKPSFKVPQGDGNDISASQNISSLAMNAGIGIRF